MNKRTIKILNKYDNNIINLIPDKYIKFILINNNEE